MKCPHCLNAFHSKVEKIHLGEDCTSRWEMLKEICPSCNKYILTLKEYYEYDVEFGKTKFYSKDRTFLCYPKAESRTSLSNTIPEKYAKDYKEACLVLPDSSKASAAISRRCLQFLLLDEGKVKKGNLSDEIQQVLDSGKLPSHLQESLDAVRNIGNFAAHPIKSQSSGEVIDVEPGEAEWNLDVLEALFDYYFVQPAIIKGKRDALNAKLKDAGKPEMK